MAQLCFLYGTCGFDQLCGGASALLSSRLHVSEFPWLSSIQLPENTWPPRRRVAMVMSSKPLTSIIALISIECYLSALIKRGQNAIVHPFRVALFCCKYVGQQGFVLTCLLSWMA